MVHRFADFLGNLLFIFLTVVLAVVPAMYVVISGFSSYRWNLFFEL